jgi:hypothetical protein
LRHLTKQYFVFDCRYVWCTLCTCMSIGQFAKLLAAFSNLLKQILSDPWLVQYVQFFVHTYRISHVHVLENAQLHFKN